MPNRVDELSQWTWNEFANWPNLLICGLDLIKQELDSKISIVYKSASANFPSIRAAEKAMVRKYVTIAKTVTVPASSLMPSNPTLSKHPLELRPRSFVVLAPLCPAGVNAARRCDLLRFLFLLRPTSFKATAAQPGTSSDQLIGDKAAASPTTGLQLGTRWSLQQGIRGKRKGND